jgi:hypothetical protein
VKIRDIKGIEKAFSQKLNATGAVKFALPDAAVPYDAEPNDPFYFPKQWHHPVINAPLAWDQVTTLT